MRYTTKRKRELALSSASATGIAFASALLLAGCSGGTTGLSQPSISQPNSGLATDKSMSAAETGKIDAAALKAPRVGVYLTASKSAAGYAHVWAPIVKIEVIDDKATAQTIWDGGTDGILADLTALASGGSGSTGGKFLGIVAAPVNGEKATERIRVTFGKSFELYPTGSTVAKTALFGDSVTRDSEGRPIISFALTKPRDLGTGKENVVIDVDLSGLNLKDDKITPTLREGDRDGLKDVAHVVETTYVGTISGMNVEGTATKFALASDQTASPAMIVQTSTATALFNDGSASNPALTDKGRVRVRGILAPDTRRVVASEIATFGSEKATPGAAALTGTVSHANAEDKTFVVDGSQVEGLTPTQAAITVTLANDAVLRGRGGLPIKSDEFWSTLKGKDTNSLVRVDGTYDPVTGSLTATRAKFENMTPTATHEVGAEGEPKFVDIGAKTFSLAAPLVKWEGIAAPSDKEKGLPVLLTAATVYADQSGADIGQSKFLDAALKDKDKIVRVVGLYGAKGQITATKVVLLPRPAATSPTALASASPSPTAGTAKGAEATTPTAGATPAVTATPDAAKGTAAPATGISGGK